MKINEQWEELKEESHANIQSKKRILNRQIRSIQTEGHFGDIKENENFRRFNYHSTEKDQNSVLTDNPSFFCLMISVMVSAS